MSDKKISELIKKTSLDSDKEYLVLAAEISAEEGNKNYGVDLNSVIPSKISQLVNDVNYIVKGDRDFDSFLTEEQAENTYLTKEQAENTYAKKVVIPTKLSSFENDENFITEDYVEGAIDTLLQTLLETVEPPDLSDYAKKSEIPTVPTSISSFINDAEYVTESSLNAKGYATESYVTTAIDNAQLGEEEEIDLSEYAKKSEIPTKTSQLINDSGFANEDRVLELINSTMPEIPSSPSVYSITNNLTNVNNSNSITQINSGSNYTATISPYTGYKLSSVTITMGGVDITSQIYADNYINITSVTGDIVITAVAILDLPESEGETIWAYKNDDFTTYRPADTSVTTAHIELTGTNYTSRVDQILQWFPNCVNIVLFSDGTVNTLNGMFGVGNQNSRSQIKSAAFESGHFEGVIDMTSTFKNCTSLEAITTSLPSSVQLLNETFYGCSKLVTVPNLSDNVTEMEYTFSDCTLLTAGPTLSGSVQIMHGTYSNCKNLETAYMSLTQRDGTSLCLDQIFDGCVSLANVILVGTANKSLWIYEMFGGVPESTIQETLRNMIPEYLDTVSDGRTLYFAAYEGTDYSTYLTEEELGAAISKGWTVSAK